MKIFASLAMVLFYLDSISKSDTHEGVCRPTDGSQGCAQDNEDLVQRISKLELGKDWCFGIYETLKPLPVQIDQQALI